MRKTAVTALASLIFWTLAALALADHPPQISPQRYMPINSAGCVGGQCPLPENHTPSRPNPAVVRIVVVNDRSQSYGSGTLVHDDASYYFILTCAHLFEQTNPRRIVIMFPDNRSFDVQLRAIDRTWDLAILQNASFGSTALGIAAIPLGKNAPRVGETLFYAGYGSTGQYQVCRGRVEGYCAARTGTPAEMLVITGTARQGDSGGPIVNATGELVGVLWGTDSRTVCGTYCGRIIRFIQIAQQENRLLGPFTRDKTPPAPPAENLPEDTKPPLSEILDQLITHYPDVVRQFMGSAVGGDVSVSDKATYGDMPSSPPPDLNLPTIAGATEEIASRMEKTIQEQVAKLVRENASGVASCLLTTVLTALSYTIPPAAVILFVAHRVLEIYLKRRKDNDDDDTAPKGEPHANP